jgi:hypothetical protein
MTSTRCSAVEVVRATRDEIERRVTVLVEELDRG